MKERGETEAEALNNALDAKRTWIKAALEDGFDIYEPGELNDKTEMMSEQKKSYKKYYESLEKMPAPIMPNALPKVKLLLNDMIHYSHEHNKPIPEFTDEELDMFIIGEGWREFRAAHMNDIG